MGLFSSLFGGNKKTEEEKNFDILKYDGIRAMRIGKLAYALKCFEEATAIKKIWKRCSIRQTPISD